MTTVARLMDKRSLGMAGEDAAAAYLRARGYSIIARNVRTREGEIDLIARLGDVLAFVEVKTRSTRAFGAPVEAVTPRKAARIRGLAAAYLATGVVHAREVSFDVVEVEPRGGTLTIVHRPGVF